MPTISITVTAAESARLQTAVGKVTGLPGDATVESDFVPIIVKIETLEGVNLTPQQMLVIEKFVEE